MSTQQVISFESLGLSKTANDYVNDFLINYFAEANSILLFEQKFIEENKLTKTKIDYTKLRRFITTALKNFQPLDSSFLSGLLLKLQMDVFSLFDFIHEFANKTKIVDMIYNNDFLKSIKEYTALQKQQEEALAKRSRFESDCNSIQERLKVLGTQLNTQEIRQEYKKLKLQLGDASHYFALAKEEYNLCAEKMNILKKTLATLFATEFKKEKEKCILGLTQAANVKAYYLDKYLWYSAQKSRPISNFLKTANIDGEYDMKTYLKYYLKNINSESTADKEWHQYLVKVMDLL